MKKKTIIEPTVKKRTAYEANDGTLFRYANDAVSHNKELEKKERDLKIRRLITTELDSVKSGSFRGIQNFSAVNLLLYHHKVAERIVIGINDILGK
jgi:hypothetical protein